ncbi:acetyltransferase [Bacillus sp. FJAT-27916]|uniref:GNAT family N-acetyltransferase n=1 Tax=Bacillaceae TaxID=186817 RepID=UPI000671038C|nr:GNAT family N-acetyltransferase [Bacillus sp. FJAT-27916]KMY46523.1 acetyltransferase [Bacillus sp. FJAT-27916]
MDIKIVTNEEELQQAYQVRKIVFVDEQKVTVEEEIDHLEEESTHFLVMNENDEPIGAGRFRIVDNYGKVERICVLPQARSTGVGRSLMEAIEQHALSQGLEITKLNAQVQAIPFYKSLGYGIISEEFLDAGIPHRTMKKRL